MLSEKEYDEIYQKGYEDGKNDNKVVVEYAIKPSFTTRKLKEQQEEIERLNNIINELEKHLLDYLDEWQDSEDDFVKGRCLMARDVIYDIYELKEGK